MKLVWGDEVFSFAFVFSRTLLGGTGYNPPTTDYSQDNRWWDSVARALTGMYLCTPPIQLDDSGGSRVIRLEKPTPLPYRWEDDLRLFGSHFGAANMVITMATYGKRRRLENEHQVVHTSLKGTVVYGTRHSYRRTSRETSRSFWGVSIAGCTDLESPIGLTPDGYPDRSSSKTVFGSPFPTNPDLVFSALEDYEGPVTSFPASYNHTQNISSGRLGRSVLLSQTWTGDKSVGYTLDYVHRVRLWGSPSYNNYWSQCDIRTILEFKYEPSFSLTPGTTITPAGKYFRWGTLSVSDSISNYSYSGYKYSFGSHPVVITQQIPVYGVLSESISGAEPTEKQIWDFCGAVRNYSRFLQLPEIAPSAYSSSTMAVERWSSLMENNYLEAASELREILSLLPDLKPFYQFLRALPRGQLLAGTLRLADFAARSYLLWKFGLEPFASELMEIATKTDELLRRIRSRSSGVKSLRGMHVHHFSVGDGFWSAFKLTTRSEVICSFPAYSSLLAILPLKLSGMDPSPSQAWDLVPFSFVVDWFFNIGGKMDAMENFLHMLTSRIEGCVHSYKIEGKVSDMPFYLGDYGFDVSDLTFTKYWRIVSGYFPPPKTSRFDFLSPSGPPMLIGASLLWVLMRP